MDCHDQESLDSVFLYALRALPFNETSAVEAHLSICRSCREELDTLRQTVRSFTNWPTDVLRPSTSLWDRLAQRVAKDAGKEAVAEPSQIPAKPDWEEVAPGISCKILATDSEMERVSMLVRLAPGTDYPPHRHSGVEELHLLHGELMIDDRKLYPGDYNRAEANSIDRRVWSETGCTCVLLASTKDALL